MCNTGSTWQARAPFRLCSVNDRRSICPTTSRGQCMCHYRLQHLVAPVVTSSPTFAETRCLAPRDDNLRSHLVKVYSSLTFTLFCCALGAVADIYYNVGGILTTLLTFGSMMYLVPTPVSNVFLTRTHSLIRIWSPSSFCP